jgi:hypothetical protein
MWHGPDEQVHFSQLAHLAETGQPPLPRKYDVTQEIYISTVLLETVRDHRGNNAFTFRPWYRIPYSDSVWGKYESAVIDLKHLPDRASMWKNEASHYPPLYYQLTAQIYNWFYDHSVIDRVFAVRWLNLGMGWLTIGIAYLVGQEIFVSLQKRWLLPLMLAWHPMFSFLIATVNSDNMFNLLVSFWLWLGVRMLTKGLTPVNTLALAGSIYASSATKPQWVIAIPIIGVLAFLLLIKYWPQINHQLQKVLLISLPISLIISLFILYSRYPNWLFYIPESGLAHPLFSYSLWDHFNYVKFHTYREVIPWYWGVFNWLGVTLPRWTHRIQMGILLLTSLGIGLKLIQVITNFFKTKLVHQKPSVNSRWLAKAFLLLAAGAYFIALETWEYFFIFHKGYAYGIQGRYFFPTIIGHLTAVILGLSVIFTLGDRLLRAVQSVTRHNALGELIKLVRQTGTVKIGFTILTVWWLILGSIGWYIVASAYYQLWPISLMITQMSQYKPLWAKAASLSLILGLGVVSQSLLLALLTISSFKSRFGAAGSK